MGKPQIPSLLRLEDYKPEFRELVDTLSQSLNPFMTDVYRQLNGQISFENMTRILATVSVKTNGAGQVINEPQVRISSLKSKIAGVAVLAAENITNTNSYPTSAPFLSYTVSTNTILIKNITGLPANSEWTLTLEIIGN